MRTTTRLAALGLVTSLALAGCGGDSTDEPSPSPAPIAATPTTVSPAPTETTPSPGDTETPTSTDLPGEPLGLTVAGATYHVVGVAHDDTLNVRTGPGTAFDVVTELDPTGSAVATGHDRLVDSGLWIELTTDAATGWANARFLAQFGGTFDITSEVLEANGGDRPQGATMEVLGLAVANLRASDEPPSSVEMVVAPTSGDLGEVTVDIVGLGDDAVKGERLVVFGVPTSDGFSLRTVEMTLLCDRGVDGEQCV